MPGITFFLPSVSKNVLLDESLIPSLQVDHPLGPIIVLSYVRINGKRDAAEKLALEDGKPAEYTVRDVQMMGGRAPDFVYTL